ncbi:MAG TPA: hypothetical protein VE244_12695 [Nitrososphaeraceae archaeon]|jgi:hypothetical protein|nr:hypothetical protein [Nitrososphaeraceae archaeon]
MTQLIPEGGGISNIPTDKEYPKISKATSGYLEIEHFKNVDLHTGYFCYNCAYFIKLLCNI